MEANNTDFTLQKNAYASFDALTLKQLIIDRLNDGGIYTDQVLEGSNISAIMDIIAYSYHTLLFYFNRQWTYHLQFYLSKSLQYQC